MEKEVKITNCLPSNFYSTINLNYVHIQNWVWATVIKVCFHSFEYVDLPPIVLHNTNGGIFIQYQSDARYNKWALSMFASIRQVHSSLCSARCICLLHEMCLSPSQNPVITSDKCTIQARMQGGVYYNRRVFVKATERMKHQTSMTQFFSRPQESDPKNLTPRKGTCKPSCLLC